MLASLRPQIEALFSSRVVKTEPVTGGCIANATKVTLESGKRIFLKYGQGLTGSFACEANGLKAMSLHVRTPEVLWVEDNFLILEWIASAPRCPTFMELLGKRLATLHRAKGPFFGWWEDNFVGANPQPNAVGQSEQSWPSFYGRERLEFQLNLAIEKGYATAELKSLMTSLAGRLDDLLAGSEEQPCLLHGDLWIGNVIADEHGEPCLIDPAVSFGHREADFAMTGLFGGFSEDFYRAYQEEYPLSPGYRHRRGLYELYPVLNHLNLFGTSYYEQAMQLLRRYV